MFKCVDCERKFEHPDVRVEKHGLDSPPYEEWNCCPYCGGDVEDYQPKKVAIFKRTMIDDYCVFKRGVAYPVIYEGRDVYHLGFQDGHKVGISRSFENQLFVIEEVDEDDLQ